MEQKKMSALLLSVLLILPAAGCAGTRLGSTGGSSSESRETVILYGNTDADDLRILKERLAHNLGAGAYELEEKGTALVLSLSTTDLHNCSVGSYLEYYLTEPQDYSLVYQPESDSSFLYHTLATPEEIQGFELEIMKETPEVAAEATEKETPGVAAEETEEETFGAVADGAEDIPVLSFGEETVGTVRVTFPADISAKIREHLDAGDLVAMMKNRTYDGYETNQFTHEGWELHVDSQEENTFVSSYSTQDVVYGHEEALKYILTTERLKRPYNYIVTDEITWQSTAGEDSWGEYQKTPEELAEDSCLLVISLSGYGARPTRGEIAEAEMFLRRRLDLLQSPYAMGTTEGGDICVQITPEHLNDGIIDALLSDDAVTIGSSYAPVVPTNVTYRRNPADSSLEVLLDGTTIQTLRTSLGNGSAKETLYLMFGALPVAKTEVTLPFAETSLVFRDYCFAGEDQISGEMDWFGGFAEELCRDPGLPVSLSLEYSCFGEDRYNDTSSCGLSAPYPCATEAFEAAAKKVCPEAEVEMMINYPEIRVYMNLPDDEQLVENIFAKGREMYEALPFEDSWFRQLNIYPYHWEGEERAVLIFEKEPAEEDDAGKISFYGILCNGRIEKHREELEEAITADRWYSTFPPGTYNGALWWK